MERPLSPFMFPIWYRFQNHLGAVHPSPAHRHRVGGGLNLARLVAHYSGGRR
jgi:hypothetical protein